MTQYSREVLEDSVKPTRKKQQPYLQIIKHYGSEHQINKAREELIELDEALVDRDLEHIAWEIADVLVMISQLLIIYDFDYDLISKMMEVKVTRTLRRMKENGKDR